MDAFADGTPFKELQNRDGCMMEKSVLLDYRRHFSFYDWVIALKNGHALLGFCMGFALISTVALVPLAAHLFEGVDPDFDLRATLSLKTSYNDPILVASIDYHPIPTIVSAVRIHGGN